MPRNLPWIRKQENERRVKQESTPKKRIKREPDPDPTPRTAPSSPDKKDFFRSSQTPPTSPARPCPAEEFLIEGLDQDDGWIMVEDEFYSIAQSFTQHLHYAEYVRKRKEAKAQSAAAMREIERQTDDQTKMPKELQMRKEVNALAALQEPVLKQPEERGENQQNEQDDSENDDDTWAGTHLHGLMTSPRKVRSLVGGAHGMKSSTRAAAGFGRTSSFKSDSSRMVSVSQPAPPSRAAQSSTVVNDDETASDDDDDLDGGSVEVIAPRVETNTPSILSGNSIKARPQMWDKKRKSTPAKGNPGLAQPRKKPTTAFKSKVIMLFDDLDELPEPSRSNHSISDQNTSRTFSDKKANDGHHDDDRKLKPKPQYKDVPTFLV